ncbi:hypothetical protein NIB75_25870 [Bacteroides uniformis]|nr:hypothetical protein [Bacteroides uniformis]
MATKGGTGYRGTAMFPSGRKKKGTKGKKERTLLFGKADGAFHEWLFFTKGYGAAKRVKPSLCLD